MSRVVKDDVHTGRKPEARENGSGRPASLRMRLAAFIGGVSLIAPLAVLGGISPAVAAPGEYEVTGSVEVGYNPFWVAVDSSTNTVYVVNIGDTRVGGIPHGSLTVIDGANNAVIATVDLPSYAAGIAVDEETHAVYVGNLGFDAISVIDPALDYALVASIPVGDPAVDDFPLGIAVDADSHSVYVANSSSDSVSVVDYSGPVDSIDPDAFSLVDNVAVGDLPYDIAVNSTSNTIYTVDSGGGTLTVLNGADNTVTTSVTVGETPGPGEFWGSVAVDEDLNTVYAVASFEPRMTVVDGADNTVITSLNLSDVAYDVAVDSSTNTVYAALKNGALAVVDGLTNTQIASVDIGTQPQGLAVNMVTHAAYVTALNAAIVPGTLWAISGTYPATVPAAPTIGTATAGNAEATVEFTAPTDDGGAEITGYTVTATDVTTPANGGQTATGAAGPITVPGLTNGDTYTFTVSATNSVGVGPESGPSNEVVPMAPTAVPGAPTIGTATAGDSEATVTFTPPTDDGGSAITEYTVTATDVTNSANGGQTVTGAAGPLTVTGLTNGDTYTFTVSATNSVGTGPESGPSNEVVPMAPTAVPGAPTIGTATAGDSEATVTFTPPTDDGGSAITEYTVTATDVSTDAASAAITTLVAVEPFDSGTSSPITVTGLTNGVTYTFTVSATNSVGTGPESAPSNEVTPATTPGAPVIGTATAGDGEATVTFTPPADYGGADITEYTVTVTDTTTPGSDSRTVSGTSSPITVTGLTNGETYTFTVSATNRVGTGPESAASNEVTPVAPSVPVVPVEPAPPVTPVSPVDPGLASTGPDLTVPLGLVGLLLAAGVALLVGTSRGRSKASLRP